MELELKKVLYPFIIITWEVVYFSEICSIGVQFTVQEQSRTRPLDLILYPTEGKGTDASPHPDN